MSSPKNGDWEAFKRLGRYLLSRPRVVHLYKWQDEPAYLSAFSDSNWAGCHKTRKSTSGACFMNGTHLIKSYSKTQANIALSSGEAEFFSMVHATSEALGLKAMTEDYHSKIDPWLYVDASAAIGVAQRTGLGKIRHLDTGSLWLQQAVRNKKIGILKVKGTENPADLMTKFTDFATLDKLCGVMGLQVRSGRAAAAAEVLKDAQASMAANVEEARRTTRVRFSDEVEVRQIPAEGKGRPCKRRARAMTKTRWQKTREETGDVCCIVDSVQEDIPMADCRRAAMDTEPPSRFPAGSLPPADVAAVGMLCTSDVRDEHLRGHPYCYCTGTNNNHMLSPVDQHCCTGTRNNTNPEHDGRELIALDEMMKEEIEMDRERRKLRRLIGRSWTWMSRGRMQKDRDATKDGRVWKATSQDQKEQGGSETGKPISRITRRDSTRLRLMSAVHDPTAGNFCWISAWVNSQHCLVGSHWWPYVRSTLDVPSLATGKCMHLEGVYDGPPHSDFCIPVCVAELRINSRRGEVCRYASPNLMIHIFVFLICAVYSRIDIERTYILTVCTHMLAKRCVIIDKSHTYFETHACIRSHALCALVVCVLFMCSLHSSTLVQALCICARHATAAQAQ